MIRRLGEWFVNQWLILSGRGIRLGPDDYAKDEAAAARDAPTAEPDSDPPAIVQ